MNFDASPISTPTKRRLILACASLVMFLIAYGMYWKAMADQLQQRVENWASQERASQAQLSYDNNGISGFPFSIDLDARNITFARVDNFTLTAPHLRLHIRPWSPFRPSLIGDEKAVIAFPHDHTQHSVDAFNIRIVRPWTTPHSYRDTGLYLYVMLNGLTLDPSLKPALGNTIPLLGFHAKIMGQVPDILNPDSVELWRQTGGIINLDKLRLSWPPISLTGEGTLTIDKNMQPLGALTATMSGYKETVDILRDQGQVKPFAASLFKAALSLLEDPKAPEGKPKTITAPVTVQNNGLFIAGINLATWQPLTLPFSVTQTSPAPLPPPAAPPRP